MNVNMNKIITYALLVLLYLGLSKAFSPSEFGINYVLNEESLEKLITSAPVSVVLIDVHSTGFLIKTYYHKYKLIYGYQTFEELIVRTSSAFKEKHAKNIGMSIFRRYERDNRIETTPLPPGALFMGDKNFGSWANHDSGTKVWKFYRVYRYIPTYLGWVDFKPSYQFYQKVELHKNQNKAFYGFNDEFGVNGEQTRKAFPNYFKRHVPKDINIKQFIKDYFKENF